MSSGERSSKYRLERKVTEAEDKREIRRRKDATSTAARRAAENDVERGIRLQKAASSTAVRRAAEIENDHEEGFIRQADADYLRRSKYRQFIEHTVIFHVLTCKGTKAAILGTCKHSSYDKRTFDEEWRALGMAPGDGLIVTYLKNTT
jgi:hypothetical protein